MMPIFVSAPRSPRSRTCNSRPTTPTPRSPRTPTSTPVTRHPHSTVAPITIQSSNHLSIPSNLDYLSSSPSSPQFLHVDQSVRSTANTTPVTQSPVNSPTLLMRSLRGSGGNSSNSDGNTKARSCKVCFSDTGRHKAGCAQLALRSLPGSPREDHTHTRSPRSAQLSSTSTTGAKNRRQSSSDAATVGDLNDSKLMIFLDTLLAQNFL